MSYSNILKNIVDDTIESSSFNVNNRLIITQELCDFETNIDLSNNNILNVNTISPCMQINCGNLTLAGNTINNTSGSNMLINNVQKINNKLLPSGDFFGKEDLLTLSQIPNGLITTNKIASISDNTFLGNNSGALSSPLALTVEQVKTMLNISNQTITLSGDITGSGTTSISATLNNSSVSLAKMSNLAVNSIIGNNTAFSIAPKALNVAEVRSMLSINFVENVSLSSWLGSTSITTLGNIPNLVAGSVKINTGLNMSSTNITSLNNINGFSLPASNFVGISDAQTLTNKTINASQLVAKSVTLDKMANIGAVTLLGNVNAFETSPAAISAVNVKTMLDLAGSNLGDQNLIGDVTSAGGTTLTTTISSGAVTLAKMANLAANSIIGNNTGVAATPKALTVSEVKSLLNLLGNLTITNNDITSSTGILNATIANINLTTATLLSIAGQKITFSTTNLSIDFNENTSSIDVTGPLNMKNYNITNVGTINGVSIPNSAIVGTSSVQTLTNKIIDGDQLVLNSVALSKLTSIDAQSFLGNREFTTGVPQILTATQAKTILSLQNVQNINVTTWAGSANMNIMGNITTSSTGISINTGASETNITLNGTNSTNNRALLFQHNGGRRIEMGLSGTNYFFIYDTVATTDVFRIPLGAANNNVRFPHYGNGTLSISGSGTTSGTLTSSSDRRLKKNEELLNPEISLQKIMNLQPKTYIWKDDVDNRTNIGFIAQDVETAIPEAIDGKKYEYQLIRDGAAPGIDGTVRVDENGIPVLDYEKPRYRGLDQCAILSTLVSAFQALVQKNNLLEARIIELENH